MAVTFCVATLQAGQVAAIQQPTTPVASTQKVIEKKENAVALALLKSMQTVIEEDLPESYSTKIGDFEVVNGLKVDITVGDDLDEIVDTAKTWGAAAGEGLRLITALGLALGVGVASNFSLRNLAQVDANNSLSISFFCAIAAIGPCLYFIKECFYKQKNKRFASRILTNFIGKWKSYKSESPKLLVQQLAPLAERLARDKELGLTEEESRNILSKIIPLCNGNSATNQLINDIGKSVLSSSQINDDNKWVEKAFQLSIPTILLLSSIIYSVTSTNDMINGFAMLLIGLSCIATFAYIPFSISNEIDSCSGCEIPPFISLALSSIIKNWDQYKKKLPAKIANNIDAQFKWFVFDYAFCGLHEKLSPTKKQEACEFLKKIMAACKA